MGQFLSSGIFISEPPPRIRNQPTIASAVAGFIGIAESGPIGVATALTSYEEFVNIFGGFITAGELALQVRQFFLLGGSSCFVVRTAHYTDITSHGSYTALTADVDLLTASTTPGPGEVEGSASAPFDLEPGDTFIGSVGGAANQTVTFTATAAVRKSTNVSPFALADLDTLTFKIDGGSVQTVTFHTSQFIAIAAATAAEVAAVLNAGSTGVAWTVGAGGDAGKVIATSDKRGTASSVEVTGGTANAGGKLNFATALTSGTGNVANIDAVTFAEIESLVEATWTNNSGVSVTNVGGKVHIATVATGASASIQVIATSTADDELGFDNATHTGTSGVAAATLTVAAKWPGAYGNDLTAEVAAATSGVASEFNFNIRQDSILVEQWPNMTMDTTADNYILTAVNDASTGSLLVQVTDLGLAGSATQRRPANVGSPYAALIGGDDGLSAIADVDFSGDEAGQTGIRAFDGVPEITMLASPDRSTTAVQSAILTYCEITRALTNEKVWAVLDPPAGLSYTAIGTHRDSLSPGETEAGGLFWPRIEIANPSSAVFGNDERLVICPSGSIMGRCSFNDAQKREGAFAQPGGSEDGVLDGVLGVENADVNRKAVRDVIYPKQINPIRFVDGKGTYIDGVMTLKANGNFPSIGERRGVDDIERTLNSGLDFLRHKNNTPELRASAERTVVAYLTLKMNQGCFASNNPKEAFFVDASARLNTPAVIAARQLKIRIGLATNSPAEFVIVEITKDLQALQDAA